MKRLLLVMFLMASPVDSLASISPYSCQEYFGNESDVPPEARNILALVPGSAARVCSVPGEPGSEAYWLISPAIRGAFGVCQFTERLVFKDGKAWTYIPPVDEPYLASRRVLIMISDETCARQDDPRYILANDVSEGVFVAVVQLWDRISSGENIDALLGNMPPEVRFSAEFRSFESAVKNGAAGRSAISLSRISRYDPAPETVTAHYALDVDGSSASWLLIVDFASDGLQILGIGTIEY